MHALPAERLQPQRKKWLHLMRCLGAVQRRRLIGLLGRRPCLRLCSPPCSTTLVDGNMKI
eukprot:scaffold10106_cov196-Skeletonema_marinoi.AAC.4